MLRFDQFKQKNNEDLFVDHKGNLGSDETDALGYDHSPDTDVKIMHIASMYGHDTFETNLFDHLLDRKFNVSITNKDVYNSLANAIKNGLIDESDVAEIYQISNSKDLDIRTDNYTKLIQFIDDLKHDKNYDFDRLVNNICKTYKLDRKASFLDTMKDAMDTGKMDIIDLRNVYNATESPIYQKKNENKSFPKPSDYENLSDDVEVLEVSDDKIRKVDMNEYEIVKVVDVLPAKQAQKIEEMQVLNLGTTMPKDIKRGDEMYLTVMLQPKNKASAYNVTNTMGVVRVRVMDIFQGLGILKSKGLM
jgi:hypothetical protein